MEDKDSYTPREAVAIIRLVAKFEGCYSKFRRTSGAFEAVDLLRKGLELGDLIPSNILDNDCYIRRLQCEMEEELQRRLM